MPIHFCPNAQCAAGGHGAWIVTRMPVSEVEAFRDEAIAQGYIVGIFGRPVDEGDDHIVRGED